jgi:hypothetical protein
MEICFLLHLSLKTGIEQVLFIMPIVAESARLLAKPGLAAKK